MQRIGPVIAVALLAAMAVGCHEELGVGPATPGERVEVQELNLVGVEAFDSSRIRSLMETEESGWLPWSDEHYFNRDDFQTDLERIEAFYHDHGYPDAEVRSFDIDLKNEGRAVGLTVTVSEGEPVRVAEIAFRNFGVLPADVFEALRASIGLKEGEPVATPAVLRARESAADALKNHGYPYADVVATREQRGDKLVALTLEAQPGPKAWFGPIEIVGNDAVDDDVIRRQLLYRPGEPYSHADVLDSQRQLTALQLFEFVNIEMVDGEDRSAEVPTRVTVAEGEPRRLSLALGYGTEEKLSADATWEHVNFLGGARTLGAHGKWSWLDRGVEGRFSQPYFLRPELALSLRARAWYVDEPGFRARSQGGRGTVSYSRGTPLSASGSYIHEFESSRIANEALRDPTLRDELIALGLNPRTGVQDGVLSALAFDVQHSTVTNPLDPREGHLLSLHTERAGGWLPGTFNYSGVVGEARHYWSARPNLTFAQRLRYGAIAPDGPESDVPFFKRFFLGGSTSLRGWGRYQVSPLSGSGLPIGGNTLFEATSEVRFPIAGNLSGVVFLDGGNVWADAWDFRAGDLLYDAGPGIRYATPIGPLRLDIAWQLNRLEGLRIDGEPQDRRWRIHFSIGQAF